MGIERASLLRGLRHRECVRQLLLIRAGEDEIYIVVLHDVMHTLIASIAYSTVSFQITISGCRVVLRTLEQTAFWRECVDTAICKYDELYHMKILSRQNELTVLGTRQEHDLRGVEK